MLSGSENTEQLIKELRELRLEIGKLKRFHEKDITELKQAEEALRESEQNYKTLANSGDILIWASGLDKPCHYFNQVWLDFTGRTLDQETNDGWLEGVHPQDVKRCIESYNAAYSKQEKFTIEYRLRRFDSEYRWIQDIGTPSYNSKGTFIGFIGQCLDITESKLDKQQLVRANEQLFKINGEKDKFFSIIAHDLRNPISSFLGLTQLLAEDFYSYKMADIQKIAASLSKSANNLYTLLENLLQWAQLQQGAVPFQQIVLELQLVVDECIAMIQEQAQQKQIVIKADIPSGFLVFADKHIIHMVIRNLISNAIKFTPRGGYVHLSAKITRDQMAEISIKDTGIGMSPSMLSNLFRLDVQTNRPGTEAEPTTGLGLLLCKDFIGKHGGSIWAESEEDKGSTFHFTIPTLK